MPADWISSVGPKKLMVKEEMEELVVVEKPASVANTGNGGHGGQRTVVLVKSGYGGIVIVRYSTY